MDFNSDPFISPQGGRARTDLRTGAPKGRAQAHLVGQVRPRGRPFSAGHLHSRPSWRRQRLAAIKHTVCIIRARNSIILLSQNNGPGLEARKPQPQG